MTSAGDALAGKRVLVTGASGFIGRVLCRRLKETGCSVRALLRREAEGSWDESVRCDLGREPLPVGALAGVDTVFHLAGVAHTRGVPEEIYWQVNLEGTRALVETAVVQGVRRFVFFSSVKAMADPPGDRCVDEGWTREPADAYGRSKRAAEEVVLAAGCESGLHAVVLRPTLVYGSGVKGNLLKILRLVASGWCPPLPDTGNRRSMVHVEDLCDLALAAVVDPVASGRRYIAADEGHHSTRELYEGLCRALGRPVPRWQVPASLLRLAGRAGDLASALLRRPLPLDSGLVSRLLDSACYSGRRAMEELGWWPRHDLLSSLPEMVAAWRAGENGE